MADPQVCGRAQRPGAVSAPRAPPVNPLFKKNPPSPPSGGIQGGPAIDFQGVQVFAERKGNRVTGRVEFPPIYKRHPVPLSYERRDSPDVPLLEESPRDSLNSASPRLQAVHRYQEALRDPRGRSRTAIADEIAAQAGVTRRTLQLWVRRAETEGEDALLNHYVPAPARKVTCDSAVATDAVLVCAWWSFRVANVKVIDSPMVAQAARLLERWSRGDILAAIDCYFAYPADRSRYRFRPFSKWAQYDFEKWFYRALEDPQYRDAVTASKSGPAPLHLPPRGRDQGGPSDQNRDSYGAAPIRDPRAAIKARRRQVNRATWQAIANLSPPDGGVSGGGRPIPNPQSPIDHCRRPRVPNGFLPEDAPRRRPRRSRMPRRSHRHPMALVGFLAR